MNSILVASVSRDPTVLIKLVQAMKPDILFLILTDKAGKMRWGKNLLQYLGERPDLVKEIKQVNLPRDLTPLTFKEEILRRINELPTGNTTELVIDTTSGLGIYRLLIHELFRVWAAENELILQIVYCDGDRRVIQKVSIIETEWREESIPVGFTYIDSPVRERLAIHGTQLAGGTPPKLVWSSRKGGSCFPATDKFSKQLFNNAGFRHLLANSFARCKYYLLHKKALESKTDLHNVVLQYQTVLKKRLAEIYQRFPRNYLDQKIRRFWSGIRCFSDPLSPDLKHFCLLVAGNTGVNIKSDLCDGISKLLDEDEVKFREKELKDSFRSDADKFCCDLNNILTSQWRIIKDHPFSMNDSEYKAFLLKTTTEECGESTAEHFVQPLGPLFERLATNHLISIIQRRNDLSSKIDSIYTGVLCANEDGSMATIEIDILIILVSGDLIVVEVKTNNEMAKRKDIESRIKNLRDCTGAYSDFFMVFPFLQREIEAIRTRDPEIMKTFFHKYGMWNFDNWSQFFSGVEQLRDQHLIGIDALESELEKKILRS